MTTSSTYAVRRTQRQNAKLLQVAKSAIWRLLFSPQPPNRRFGEPEGSKAAQFSPTLAWTYVPCCPQAYLLFNVTIASPPKPPPKQVGYPRQVSLEKFLKLGIPDKFHWGFPMKLGIISESCLV